MFNVEFQNVAIVIKSAKPMMVASLGIAEYDYDAMAEQGPKEFTENRSYLDFYYTFGRKPLNTD